MPNRDACPAQLIERDEEVAHSRASSARIGSGTPLASGKRTKSRSSVFSAADLKPSASLTAGYASSRR